MTLKVDHVPRLSDVEPISFEQRCLTLPERIVLGSSQNATIADNTMPGSRFALFIVAKREKIRHLTRNDIEKITDGGEGRELSRRDGAGDRVYIRFDSRVRVRLCHGIALASGKQSLR